MKKFILFALVLAIGFAGIANAQVKDKAFGDWTVYTMNMQGKKTCYIATFPKGKSGNYAKRDEPYFMVTYLGDDVAEVSTSSGYKYKDGSKVSVDVGHKKLTMFTAGELAWAKDRQGDKEFISTMKKQNDMRVKGSSAMDSYSIDKYSLKGFGAAYDRMKAVCSK